MLYFPFAGQIECYDLSSGLRSSYEGMFASPVGISLFDRRAYVSDSARETLSSVDYYDMSSEHLMQRNVQQPGVLKVYSTSLNGNQRQYYYYYYY